MSAITVDRKLLQRALKCAEDTGYPLALIADLRAALAQERQTSHGAEQERGMAQPVERTCGQQTARKPT